MGRGFRIPGGGRGSVRGDGVPGGLGWAVRFVVLGWVLAGKGVGCLVRWGFWGKLGWFGRGDLVRMDVDGALAGGFWGFGVKCSGPRRQ